MATPKLEPQRPQKPLPALARKANNNNNSSNRASERRRGGGGAAADKERGDSSSSSEQELLEELKKVGKALQYEVLARRKLEVMVKQMQSEMLELKALVTVLHSGLGNNTSCFGDQFRF